MLEMTFDARTNAGMLGELYIHVQEAHMITKNLVI